MDTTTMLVYMPTTDYSDEEIEQEYAKSDNLINEEARKGKCNRILMGDWNSIVGEGADEKHVGDYGPGRRNERGERMVRFCKQHNLVIASNWFKQHKRRRYTWRKKTGDTGIYQIDYLIVKQWCRNTIKKKCKNLPSSRCKLRTSCYTI